MEAVSAPPERRYLRQPIRTASWGAPADLIVRRRAYKSAQCRPPHRDAGSTAHVAESIPHDECASVQTPDAVATDPRIAYLDSSALVKLIAIEAHSAALRQELRRWPGEHRVCWRGSRSHARPDASAGMRQKAPRAHLPAWLLAIDPIVPAVAQIAIPCGWPWRPPEP
jgi:hypothetical protein